MVVATAGYWTLPAEQALAVSRSRTEKERRQRKGSHAMFDEPIIVEYPYFLLNVELTNFCVMKCHMCPRTRMTREQGHMDLRLFRDIADQYVRDNPVAGTSFTMWLHHFGESVLHPEFDEAISYAKKAGLRPGISLNPSALSKEKAERLFKAKPSEVYFVVDGYDDESFFTFRGIRNVFDKTITNTLLGIEMKKSYSPDTLLSIVVIDIPGKKELVDRIVAYWRSHHGIDLFRKPFTTWNGDIPEITSLGGGGGMLYQAGGPCPSPRRFMSINWDGIVVPCCHDYDKLEAIGDANREPLAEIWNGMPMQRLREQLNTGRINSKLCRTCQYTYHCCEHERI